MFLLELYLCVSVRAYLWRSVDFEFFSGVLLEIIGDCTSYINRREGVTGGRADVLPKVCVDRPR